MKRALFKEPLFIASVQGFKTNTRRPMGIVDCGKSHKEYHPEAPWKNEPMEIVSNKYVEDPYWYCKWCGNGDDRLKPSYKVGEIVYLPEPYKIMVFGDHEVKVEYKYLPGVEHKNVPAHIDFNEWFDKRLIEQEKSKSGFCNKLFMPEWLARYYIQITNVRAERIQNISPEDCLKEGLIRPLHAERPLYGIPYIASNGNIEGEQWSESAIETFGNLIKRSYGDKFWDENTYCWVYEYRICER